MQGSNETDRQVGADERKRELRAFLMSRRARLQPADVGLPQTARRRAPGLRREEVAALAGLSTAWYTLFEMAKETRVSRRTLDAIAAALKLSPAESRHLYVLADANAAGPPDGDRTAIDPIVEGILDGFRIGPALVLSERSDVLAMNDIAVALFGDLTAAAGNERNWLWLLLSRRLAVANAFEQAPELAAMFRATYCEHAADPAYTGLLDELLQSSEAFAASWLDHDVSPSDDPYPLVFDHPRYGKLQFDFRAFPISAHDRARCCFLVPDASTRGAQAYVTLLGSLPPSAGRR